MDENMNYKFQTIAAATYRIHWALETKFKLMVSQLRPSLVIYLIPIGLSQMQKTRRRSYEFYVLFIYLFIYLKTLKLWHFYRLTFNLFHSIIVDGKKEFFKKLWLVLKQGILSEFLSGQFVFLAWIKSNK